MARIVSLVIFVYCLGVVPATHGAGPSQNGTGAVGSPVGNSAPPNPEAASILPIASKRGDQTDKLSKKVFSSPSGNDPLEGLGETAQTTVAKQSKVPNTATKVGPATASKPQRPGAAKVVSKIPPKNSTTRTPASSKKVPTPKKLSAPQKVNHKK